ncbi:hypothetical protein CHS0354_007206 [Potamilus streckersoni]|uniref:Ig-like domain-containing protein n=1 Tax=Potamilus streckersoni TaxID=2493646 RepID=A0AAE0T6D7_9BIVA|nr:hypothetical protein CHS0354_007206 [Potamilus streckersoni]
MNPNTISTTSTSTSSRTPITTSTASPTTANPITTSTTSTSTSTTTPSTTSTTSPTTANPSTTSTTSTSTSSTTPNTTSTTSPTTANPSTTSRTSTSISTTITDTTSTTLITVKTGTTSTTSTSTSITTPATSSMASSTIVNPSTVSTTSTSKSTTIPTTTSTTSTTAKPSTTSTTSTSTSNITPNITSSSPTTVNLSTTSTTFASTSTTTPATTSTTSPTTANPSTTSTTSTSTSTTIPTTTITSSATAKPSTTSTTSTSTSTTIPTTTSTTSPTTMNPSTTSTTSTTTSTTIPTTTSTISPTTMNPSTISATSTSTSTTIPTTTSTTSPTTMKSSTISITSTSTSTKISPTSNTTSSTLTQSTTSTTSIPTSTTTPTTTSTSPTTVNSSAASTTSTSTTTTLTTTASTTHQPTTKASTTGSETTTTASTVNKTMSTSETMMTTIQQPTTIPPLNASIAFSKDNYSSILGTPLQLTCMVTGWDNYLNITRVSKLSQSEVNVVSLVNNETRSIHSNFAVNKTFSESKVHVFIFILNMTCDDEGTYYCKSGSASDSATVKRERVKPTLILPNIMIRDGYHNINYPFVCEAEVETPEVLIAEVNRNGTYFHYEGFGENRQNIIVDCVQKQIFKFYINGIFTQDWDNAKIRCVVMNNLTNVKDDILLVSDENTIRLLPADICSGVADGSNIAHPYSTCNLFLTCQSGVPVLGKCQQGQCFYDNIGTCRAPKCPFLYCRDTEVNIGDSASITCEIIFCNDSFSLSVKHSDDILFSNASISGNISLKSDDNDITISVSRGAAAVTLTLSKTNCNHTGDYIFILDRESFIDQATLRLKVPPKIPTLELPQSIVAYRETTISCTGEQGVPPQNMYIEVMLNSSNFSKYDKTTFKRKSQNCSNIGTLMMNFFAEDIWDGARIRCVIGDKISSRLESDVHEINITYTGVRFSSTKFTGLMNDTVQMNCIVNSVFNGDSISVSRSNSGTLREEIISIVIGGNSTGSNREGIQISTTNLSVNEFVVHVNIESLQCNDGGTYYCKTGNRTATTTLEIWRKPDKPKLKLPVDVIRNGYNQGGDPFVCEGNVGYPEGDLTVLFNKDGNFKEAQPFRATKTTGNVTECGRLNKFEFYLNTFTSDLHNSTVRCVATNNKTLSNESSPFDDKVLLLVPENTCYGATEGLILPYPYPFYDCRKYLYCSWNRTFVIDGTCKDGECYYTDIKRCEQERTTTTTKPTTTTQPTCPSVTCSGAEPIINSAATIACALILCGDEFDLVIELDSKVQFRETMRGNSSSSFLSNALLNLVVKDKTAELNIVFENIMCNQSGSYNVSIYGRNVSSVASIRVRVNPEKPNITAPRNIYKNQKAIISCIGQLGIPNAAMFWQLMLPGGNFESYSVSGSPDISKRDCSVIGNWTIGIYPEQSWNGGGIRCVTKTQGNPSVEIHSDAIAITLEEPDIYFVPPSSSGYIGSSHSITCIARDMMSIMSVKIERQTISGLHEVASLSIDRTSTANFIGIRIRNTSMINSTAATVYMDFDSLTCADKGDYFCTIGAFSSRGNLSVLRKPEVPQLVTFPTSGIVENTASGTINCTGEVGYPARKLVFESNKGGNNTFARVPFSFTSTQMEGECSTTYSATFSYTFNMDWNNSVIRCKIDTEDVLGDNGTSLYVDRKVLIIPGNICKTSNALFVPHPYACRKYLWCADRIYLQDCSPPLCHLNVPDNSTACDHTCNDCTDSF